MVRARTVTIFVLVLVGVLGISTRLIILQIIYKKKDAQIENNAL